MIRGIQIKSIVRIAHIDVLFGPRDRDTSDTSDQQSHADNQLAEGFMSTEAGGRQIGEFATLQHQIDAWSLDINSTQRGVDWQIKFDDARCKLKSVYPKIQC
jgi:hypothetical protein